MNFLKMFRPLALHSEHSGLGEFLHEHLGEFGCFLNDVVLHSLLEVLKLVLFLFLTYLLMEFIEHKSDGKAEAFMRKSGKFGPLVGGALGIIPQCGFSSVGANLFSGKIISLGTLVAIFLATSDEMLPLMISNSEIKAKEIAFILLYKVAVAIIVGFAVDIILHLMKKDGEKINIDEICDNDNCHCDRGIWYSALHHTVHISVFIAIACFAINLAIYLIGEENLSAIMYNKPVISHIIAAIFGLIPNCAASVALTEFYTSGFITLGTMLSGLFSGAGVGLLVLFKINKHIKINLVIVAILVVSGALFGGIADAIGLDTLIS